MRTLGERIKKLRGTQSQKWLAEKLGIPSTTLSNYENNKSELNFATIHALKTIFNVSTDWLLFGLGSAEHKEGIDASFTLNSNVDIASLNRRIAELELQNALFKELAEARKEALCAKEETLIAYKQMLNYTQNSFITPKKEKNVATSGACACAPFAPLTSHTNK